MKQLSSPNISALVLGRILVIATGIPTAYDLAKAETTYAAELAVIEAL